ncbi:hypothetical protein Tco_1380763 [Tanacetum coccineum]
MGATSCAPGVASHNAVEKKKKKYGSVSGKEIDIGMDKGCDKALRPTDMLLYSQDRRLDVCVDLTESSPLTQTRMANFAPGRAVIDAAQRKRVKYEAKCKY